MKTPARITRIASILDNEGYKPRIVGTETIKATSKGTSVTLIVPRDKTVEWDITRSNYRATALTEHTDKRGFTEDFGTVVDCVNDTWQVHRDLAEHGYRLNVRIGTLGGAIANILPENGENIIDSFSRSTSTAAWELIPSYTPPWPHLYRAAARGLLGNPEDTIAPLWVALITKRVKQTLSRRYKPQQISPTRLAISNGATITVTPYKRDQVQRITVSHPNTAKPVNVWAYQWDVEAADKAVQLARQLSFTSPYQGAYDYSYRK